MHAGREFETILLQSPRERPVRGVARNIMYGCVIAALFILFRTVADGFDVRYLTAYMLVGNAISFFGWGAERLWYSMVSKMLMDPFSIMGYLSRIPFWYMAGGIGYLLAMLTAKKIGLLDVNDLPVKQLFNVGGKIGCAIQVPLQIMVNRKFKTHDTY